MDNRTVGSALVDMSDLNSPFLSDGSQQLQQNPAVQGVEHIMMLMLEVIRLGFQLVQQRGANNPQRVLLGEKGDGVRPGLQVNGIRGAAIVQLPAALFRFQNSERHIFLQFLADCGDIRLPAAFKIAQILLAEQVQNLLRRIGFATAQQIQNIEVEGHIPGGEALGLEGVVQGIGWNGAAVHGQEYILPIRVLAEAHEVSQPAFHPAALVIIAAGALFVIFRPALETVHIKLPHIIPNAVEILDELAIGHVRCPLP